MENKIGFKIGGFGFVLSILISNYDNYLDQQFYVSIHKLKQNANHHFIGWYLLFLNFFIYKLFYNFIIMIKSIS